MATQPLAERLQASVPAGLQHAAPGSKQQDRSRPQRAMLLQAAAALQCQRGHNQLLCQHLAERRRAAALLGHQAPHQEGVPPVAHMAPLCEHLLVLHVLANSHSGQ